MTIVDGEELTPETFLGKVKHTHTHKKKKKKTHLDEAGLRNTTNTLGSECNSVCVCVCVCVCVLNICLL